MRIDQSAWIYILANKGHKVLYIGVTNDLERRVGEHKVHAVKGFTDTYNVDKLVYFEEFQSMQEALAREKQLKGWSRAKKNALIETINPYWLDLSYGKRN